MKVLITGSKGQLGQCFKSLVGDNKNYIFTTRKEFDITNINMMRDYLKDNKDIDVIINCAAYTDVKKCETEDGYQLAKLINIEGVKNLATICNEFNIFLIHFGTDYIYDDKCSRYFFSNSLINKQTDSNYPLNENVYNWRYFDEVFYEKFGLNLNKYGYTKMVGIKQLFNKMIFDEKKPNFIVIIVSWLFSEYGKNFVKTIYDKISKDRGSDLQVVNTQTGSPTYAMDLARFIIDVIENNNGEFIPNPNNIIYHSADAIRWCLLNFTNLGCTTWFDFAKAIEFCTEKQTTNKILPRMMPFDDVKRPNYSVLDNTKLLTYYKNKNYVRHWLPALKETIGKLDGEKH